MMIPPQGAANQTLLVPVQGESGAQMYPVAAGTTVALIDFASCCFWLKATDTNGFPQKMRKFEFKEVTPQQTGDTVTRQEFDELKSMLAAALGGMKNEQSDGNAPTVSKVRK